MSLTKRPEPKVIYEDNHLIAVNKPAGMPAQEDISGDLCVFEWVKEYIRITYEKPGKVYLALLHRLDRPTGGIMLMAKTSKAAARVSQLFQRRQIHKSYLALTERTPKPLEGKLVHYLKPIPGKNIIRAYQKEVEDSKRAELNYQLICQTENGALLRVRPETGRKHQIRVQLSSIGCPIRGDKKYGATTFNPDKSICLLAHKLQFLHPTLKEEIILEVPIPESWGKIELP